MSVENILAQIDDMLVLLDQVDSGLSNSFQVTSQILTEDDVKEGQMLRVTNDLQLLESAWKEAELGTHDQLNMFLNAVGKVTEIEDDGTVQLRWENYDTAWIPVKACSDAGNSPPTLVDNNMSWIPDKPDVTNNVLNCTDVQEGQMLQVTNSLELLEKEWKKSELGPHDQLSAFLGAIGKIIEIEEDDFSVQLRWENYDTSWIPVRACSNAGNKKATSINLHVLSLSAETNSTSYIKSDAEIKEGDLLCITKHLDRLQSEWKASELGNNDELDVYLNMIGKIMEIEDDDETVQLRWENYDTVWIPYKACSIAATDAKVTCPRIANSWLP